jgi:hypothetical protein
MTITTKFNIYDEVWCMYNDKVTKSIIVGIMICKTSSKCQLTGQITYYLDITSNNILRHEHSLFLTKEEL